MAAESILCEGKTTCKAAETWAPFPTACRDFSTSISQPGEDGYDEWAAEGMAMAADPDPDYGKDLDDEFDGRAEAAALADGRAEAAALAGDEHPVRGAR